MAAEWFVIVKDEVRGPYSADQMRAAAKSGIVQASTNVRKGADGDWFRADQIQGLLPGQVTPASEPTEATRVTAAHTAAATAPQTDNASVAAPLVTTVADSAPTRHSRRGPNRRRANPWPVIAVGALAVGLLLVMLYVLANGEDSSPAKGGEKAVNACHEPPGTATCGALMG